MAALGWLINLDFAGGGAPAPQPPAAPSAPNSAGGGDRKKKKKKREIAVEQVIYPVLQFPVPEANQETEPDHIAEVSKVVNRLQPPATTSIVEFIKREVVKATPAQQQDVVPTLYTEALYRAYLKQVQDEDELILRWIQSLS